MRLIRPIIPLCRTERGDGEGAAARHESQETGSQHTGDQLAYTNTFTMHTNAQALRHISI